MGSSAGDFPAQVPQLRLDDLLDELQTRLTAAKGTRDQVHGLLEAVLGIGRGLELTQVLRHIVESATVLVDAEYGALGVIDEDGKRLAQFLTVGLGDAEIAGIGAFPTGHGILGELIRNPEPLRLENLADHPASYGFPPNHPPMRTFLGVPIRVRDMVFGNLYLTDKHGGQDFDAEDESVVQTLAAAAGVAVDNARLYAGARLRERWMQANGEITSALLSGAPHEDVQAMILDLAKEIGGADLAVLALPGATPDELVVERAIGEQAQEHQGLVLPLEGSLAGAAMLAGEAVLSLDVRDDPRTAAGPPRFAGLGPGVAVPMGTEVGGLRGVLLLVRAAGKVPFTSEDSLPLLGFAGQAALAMELAERRREGEQIALLEDRDRIARDLHDLAIQRLFATGLTLQSALPMVTQPMAAERVRRAIDDLDETVRIIRSTIFGLRAHEGSAASGGLRARAVGVVGRVAVTLGFTPALRLEGLLDTDVPATTADESLAALEEALSNVVRHAQAGAAQVTLAATEGELHLSVTDDGVGIPAEGHRSGLRNLAERAELLGGKLTVGQVPAPDRGTRLSWRVPLATAE